MRVSLGWASFARMSTAIPLLFALPNASHAEIDLTRLSTWGSSTMERMAGGFSSLAAEGGLRFFNGGDGGAYTDSVLAVQGSMPAELSFSAPGLGTLAGSGEVAVNIPNVQTNPQANSWTGRLGATGVTGTVRYSATEGAWVFTASGGDLSVLEAGRNYSFLPDVGTEFAEGFQVLNLGKNDFFRSSTADEIVQWSIDTFAALEDAEKRVLVMGHFMNEEAPYDPAIRARILEVNQRLKDTFGDNYIDLQAYVTGAEIWEDMGITPTAEDLAAQAAGYKPPSLSADLLHLTMDASRSVVDNLVAPRFRALYTEAFADVHLTAARRHLLPALSGIAADGQGAANRMARAERAQLFTDLVHGDQRDGLSLTAMAGAGRAERPEGKGRDLTVGAAYRHGDWRTGLSFGRHKTELTIPGATAEIDREELTLSLGWTDERWLISGQAGVSRGEASGRSSDGTIASYSGDVVSRYLEVGLGRKLSHGDWSVTPEAWLRWQQAALKDLRYRHGGGTSASIGRHESEAGILGFGVDLAYRGWQGEGLNLLPGLRVSYENVISQSQDDFVFGGLIAGRSLGGALGGRLKDNVLIEPSMSFDLPGQGRAVLGAWYSSGDKNKGMNLRVSYRF